jgi:hypothetical protein
LDVVSLNGTGFYQIFSGLRFFVIDEQFSDWKVTLFFSNIVTMVRAKNLFL